MARGLWAAWLLTVGWFLHREGADFSWEYHNDESSKVAQVLEGWRNYRHPPLMLDVVAVGRRVWSGLDDPQEVVAWGRRASALYGAAAVALMADAAWMAAGPWAGVGVGLVLLCHGPSYEMAHYFKEDSLFLLGMAMLLHAVVGGRWRPAGAWGVAWLVGGWVCVGAKWVGWLPWLLASVPTWRALAPWPRWRIGLVVLFMLGVGVSGARYFCNWDIFSLTSREEWKALWSGDYDSGVPVPHGRYFALLAELAPCELWWAAVGFGLGASVWRMPGAFWALFCAGLSCLVLAWTAKYSDRYGVPQAWLLLWLGVAGAAACASRVRFAPRMAAAYAVVLMTLGFMLGQWDDFEARRAGFTTDSRALLQAWLAEQETDGWNLVQDDRAMVGLASSSVMESSFFAADLGTLEELRARGITHVVVCYEIYHRYVDGMVCAQARSESLFRRRESFYRDLFERHRVVWSVTNRHPKPLHPGLSVVDLR